jgi:glycosyltransferase involved in cell wall biosynthesis
MGRSKGSIWLTMKIFVLAIGARDRASSRWRIWDHVDWLRQHGNVVRADSLATPGLRKANPGFVLGLVWRYPRWIVNFFWSDVAVVQETLQLWPAVLFKNVGKRRRLIFDFSDPIDRLGSGLKRRLRRMMFDVFIRRADAIVVENKTYIGLLGQQREKCFSFYGPVDVTRFLESRESLRAGARTRPLRIGWTGSHGTLKFIEPLLPIIDGLAKERDIEVMLVGIDSADIALEHAKLTVVPFDEAADFRNVPTFDLGLFRLEDNEDALWRGAGKLFIYMAGGAPFIATDRGIASRLMQESKVGFAVKEEADWPEMLRRAVEDEDARRCMIERSLAFAREQLSYEKYRIALLAHVNGASEERATP